MEWREYKVYINDEAEDSVSELLMSMGSTGVSVTSRADFENLPEYQLDTLWKLDESKFPKEGIIIKAYFPLETSGSDFNKELHNKLDEFKSFDLGIKSFKIESSIVQDSDWENKWKKFYSSVSVTRYLTIVPEWETYKKKQEDEQLIIMDPGLAFGTGTHPTTQLSIQALETTMRGNETIIDVGTGSGVLAIASSHLGAKEVFAYDLDEQAVTSAKSNIALNELNSNMIIAANNLLEGVTITADIVVANILANIVIQLIPDAMRVLNAGGYFIASGIIDNQKPEVLEALKKEGFAIKQINQMEDWVVIIAQKP